MLYALGIVLVNALAIQASVLSHTRPGDDIESLCARKSIDLTKFSQLKSLGQAVGGSSCSETLKEAIPGLVELILSGQDDLCSENSINTLRAYYTKYLDTSGPVDEDKELLPSSLRKFVIAYGMQVSNLCKKNMLKVLTDESEHLVEESDFAQLDMLIREDGPVAQVLGAMGDPGDVFLPGDLVPFFKKYGIKPDEEGGEKLILQTATADYIKKVQSVCQHRFKPVYEPLMLPLVRLVKMGFNYKDEPLKSDLKSEKVARDVGVWSRIVFGCETITSIRIVEDRADQAQGEGSSNQLVRILTKEEADAIEGAAQPEEDMGAIDLVYTPTSKVALQADEIFNKSDKLLERSIKSFKTSRSEEQIFKKRVTKKSFELIRKQLKSGHFGFILSTAWKGAMIKRHGVDSASKQFVETLNEMIEQQANNQDRAIARKKEGSGNLTMAIFCIIVWAAIIIFVLHLCGVIG